jgi:hypothetical protein
MDMWGCSKTEVLKQPQPKFSEALFHYTVLPQDPRGNTMTAWSWYFVLAGILTDPAGFSSNGQRS